MGIVDQYSGQFPAGHEHPSGVLELTENAAADWCHWLVDAGPAMYSFGVGREYDPLMCINELDELIKSERVQNSLTVKSVRLFFVRVLTARLTGVPWDRVSEHMGEVNVQRHMLKSELTFGDAWNEDDLALQVVLSERKYTEDDSERLNCWQVLARLQSAPGVILGMITYSDGQYIAAHATAPLYRTTSINKAKRYLHTAYVNRKQAQES